MIMLVNVGNVMEKLFKKALVENILMALFHLTNQLKMMNVDQNKRMNENKETFE